MTMLEIRNIDFSYGTKAVLSGIDLALNPGEVTAILGPNGAGKSTLINVMSGSLVPSNGSVHLEGKGLDSYSSNERARRVAVVAQESHIPFPFTALEIVLMGRAPYLPAMGFERRIDVEAALHAMSAMDCEEFAGRDVRELSGGERRRVIIARALAQQTEVLLLDEPTNFLDIKHATELAILLRDLAKTRKISVCAVMHDINLAAAIGDRLVLMKDGRIAASGSPSEVMQTGTLRSVFEIELAVHRTGPGKRPFCTPM